MHTQTRLASLLIACAATLAPLATPPANAQQTWKQLPGQEKYVQRYEPFRVVGNLYYVGTYDLAVFLITTPQGHMLVNTGVNDSADYIRASIEKLGFKYSDIKLLLATHGHWDHVAAMAQIKRDTGARMLMHEDDADLVESGGSMKALIKSKSEPGLWLQDVPEPAIGINDVLIRVFKTGICGTDLHIYNWDAWARKTIPVPMVVGHEFMGQIAAVGSAVEGLEVGSRVAREGHITCGHCRNCRALFIARWPKIAGRRWKNRLSDCRMSSSACAKSWHWSPHYLQSVSRRAPACLGCGSCNCKLH